MLQKNEKASVSGSQGVQFFCCCPSWSFPLSFKRMCFLLVFDFFFSFLNNLLYSFLLLVSTSVSKGEFVYY